MNESSEGLNYSEMKTELQALRKKLEDLETKQAAFKISSHPNVRRRFPKNVIIALISLAALVAAGGLLWGQGAIKALFVDPNGNVGISTTDPKATLDVAGTLNVTQNASLTDATVAESLTAGTLKVTKNVGINRDPIPDQSLVITPIQGNIPFNVTDPANSLNWLSVFANGSVIMNGGNVGIGTINPAAKLDVVGDVRIQGRVTSRGRYQRDDDPETTYEIPPRYHLSLTAPKYGGRTKAIPQDVLVGLCGGPDGCEVRLAMTRWDNDIETESASRSALFYYSANDGRWRASIRHPMKQDVDVAGVDGDGVTQHVLAIWDTCYFTDGTYANYQDLGDKEKGMQLLVWKGYGNANRTCELTLIK